MQDITKTLQDLMLTETREKQFEESVKKQKQEYLQSKIDLTKKITSYAIAQFETFLQTKNAKSTQELIDLYTKIQTLDDYKNQQIMADKAKLASMLDALIQYLFEIEDLDKIETVLILKAGKTSKFERDILKKRLTEFAEALVKNTIKPQDSHYILGSGEMSSYIERFFALCGKLDKASAPKDFVGIYKSPKFKKYLLKGACGYYGAYVKYVYMDAPFSHEYSDMKTFLKIHDEAFAQSSQTKEAEEK